VEWKKVRLFKAVFSNTWVISELSKAAWTLRSQVRILLGAGMCVWVFLCCVVLCR
jgi:hypothetical protein